MLTGWLEALHISRRLQEVATKVDEDDEEGKHGD